MKTKSTSITRKRSSKTKSVFRRDFVLEKLEERCLLAGDLPLIQLMINPRTADDTAFSPSAFNSSTRELTVDVDEIFHLEVLYADLREPSERLGAFAIYTDILFEPGTGLGFIEPALTETQLIEFDSNIVDAVGGSIFIEFDNNPDNVVAVNAEDFFADPSGVLSNAIATLGYANTDVNVLLGQEGKPTDLMVRFNDYDLIDIDLPNLILTPFLFESTFEVVDVTVSVEDIPPRLQDGSLNQLAISYNLDFDSRSMSGPADSRSGESFYNPLFSSSMSYSESDGFFDIGSFGRLLADGYLGLGRGSLPVPFDAFSLPVRIRQPAENLAVYLDPPNTTASQILLYGTPSTLLDDQILVDSEVDASVSGTGTGVLFISAVDAGEVTIVANDGVITVPRDGAPTAIDLTNLVTVSGTTAPVFIASVTPPDAGVVFLEGNVVTYVPDSHFVGVTSFSYTASVEGILSSGNITVNVTDRIGDIYEPNDTFATAFDAGPIFYSSVIERLSIHDANDRDFFRFETLAEGDSRHFVEIAFDHGRGDLDMQLRDSQGNIVATSNGVDNSERISFSGRPAGTYVLEVYGFFGATNDYTISFSAPEATLPPDDFEPNDTLSTAADLGGLSGLSFFEELTIHSTTDRDFFKFETVATGLEGHFISIFFDHAAGDIDMTLRDSQGAIINSSLSVLDFESISLQGLPAGVYYVEVYGFAGAVNRYDLYLSTPDAFFQPDIFEPNNSRQSAFNLDEVAGEYNFFDLSIHDAADLDFFRFETLAEGTFDHFVEIKFIHSVGDIDMRLWDNSGNVVGGSFGVVDLERISLQGLAAGVYFIEVYGFAGSVNHYDMSIVAPEVTLPSDRFEQNDSIATATNLRVVEGMVWQRELTIHDTTDKDFFRFELASSGTSDHYVQVLFNHSEGDIDVQLLDANGKTIVSSTGVTDQEFLTLQGLSAGVYYIEVYGVSGAINRYDLVVSAPQSGFAPDRFESNNSLQTATNLRSISGVVRQEGLTIHNSQDVDFFRFETTAVGGTNDFVQLTFSHSIGDIDMTLYDASGNVLAGSYSVSDTEQVSLLGRPAGVYFVEVYGFSGATNRYDLMISAPTATIPADRFEPNNQFSAATDLRQVSGTVRHQDLSIHQAGDRDFFRFETLAVGNSLSRIEIDFRHSQGNLNANLYDASQNLIFQANSSSDNETIGLSGLAQGTYFLEVFGINSAVNRYGLTINAPVGSQGLQADRFESNNTRQTATDLRELDNAVSLDLLTIHNASDRDFFRFTTLSRGTSDSFAEIRFAHATGNLDMQLLDGNGNVVRLADSVNDNERISLEGLPAATYFVEIFGVSGAINPYRLEIQPPTRAGFTIEVAFPENNGFTARQQEIVRQSAARWERIIIGDLPPVMHSDGTIIDDVRIQFSARNDLPPNVLGRAFTPLVRPESRLPYFGRTEYSSQFLATRTEQQFFETVNHEIAHILGMFSPQILVPLGLVVDHEFRTDIAGNVISHNPNVRYLGPQAVTQFQRIFNTNMTFIPLEGRPLIGSYGSHWPTWFGPEVVMTFGGAPISPITVGVMADVGYRVNMSAADTFIAPPNTPPIAAAGEGEAFVFYGGLHQDNGHHHDGWEIIYVDEDTEPGEVLALLPFESMIPPDDFEMSSRLGLTQSQLLTGLSIHDPDLWGQVGNSTDVFEFSLNAQGHVSQFVRVEPGRPGMGMLLRLFAHDDVNRQTVLAESADLMLSFEGLAARDYVLEISGQVGTYDLELNLGKPISADRLVGTFWGEAIDIDLLQSVVAIGVPLAENPLEILSDPSVGTVTLLGDGRIRFEAGEEFLGDASFEYRVFDQSGQLSESSTVTIRVNGNPLQNAVVAADVLRNNRVEPLDALVVLTRLARAFREGFSGSVPIEALVDEIPRYYFDVDGNGRVEPLDALLVLTHIARANRVGAAVGESVAMTEMSDSGSGSGIVSDQSTVESIDDRFEAVDLAINDLHVAQVPFFGEKDDEDEDGVWLEWLELQSENLV